jgi:hypothetical protein
MPSSVERRIPLLFFDGVGGSIPPWQIDHLRRWSSD